MRSGSGTSWISRSHRDSPTPSDHSTRSHQPLTPTYTAPRLAPPPPPGSSTPKSSFKALHSVFRKPNRAPSLHSAYSASTTTSSSEHHTSHPYSAMHIPPLPVVSNRDALDDEEECPVCLEPLSFSFRLPGEKPHIVPECGHALHEVCTNDCTISFSSLPSIRHASLPSMAHLQTKPVPPFPENPILEFVVSADDP